MEAPEVAAARPALSGKPWYVPHALHVQAAFAAPKEHEQRLVAFFTAALGDPRTP